MSDLPLPLRVQQETLRANNCCGNVSLSGVNMCVKPLGHDDTCGDGGSDWEQKPEPYNAKELWIIDEIFSGDPDQMAYKIRQRADYLFPDLKTRWEDDNE